MKIIFSSLLVVLIIFLLPNCQPQQQYPYNLLNNESNETSYSVLDRTCVAFCPMKKDRSIVTSYTCEFSIHVFSCGCSVELSFPCPGTNCAKSYGISLDMVECEEEQTKEQTTIWSWTTWQED